MRVATFVTVSSALLIASLAMLCNGARAAESATGVANYDLAALPDAQFDMKGWSAPAADGAIKFRTALAARAGAARINAWWKEGDLRPPEGNTYILEVKYKDVLTKPAQFWVNSGIGSSFGNYPLHRFGGAHDGQWKTANIPCPWDMVARIVSSVDPARNAPQMTSFTIQTPSDLPIASITVRNAIPGDEPNFYAECRAQIAAEQADERAKNPMPAVKDAPVVKGPAAAFPWEPTRRLFTNEPFTAGDIGKPVKVRMCLNQLESGSFGVYANGAALSDVEYEVTPLTSASGDLLNASVDRRTAEYSLLDGKWIPMRLWPAYAIDIPAGHCQWFYFNVETRRGEAKPGTYNGKILITAKGAAVGELPLEVEVLPIDLMTMGEAGIIMHGCYDKLPPLHDVEFEHRYNYNGALLWYKGFTIPIGLEDGKIAYDFTYPDDWMKGARKRGFTSAIWYLGGDPYGFPRTLSVMAHLGTLDKKMTRVQWCEAQMAPENRDAILPATRKLFVEWMRGVNAHAIDNGWLELFPTPHDEPQKWASSGAHGDKETTLGTGPWIKPFFKDGCAAIREADPRIRIYGCIHHVANWHGIPNLWKVFIDDIDVYNTNAAAEDSSIGDKIRAASAASIKAGGRGKLFWQYTGLGGGVPDSQRYSFGFYFGAFGSTGCTAWAYNWAEAWDLSGRKGDLAVTAWPTAYQTIPSPWMESQREGLDDRRIIATYQKRFANDPAAMKVLNDIFEKVKNSRSKRSGNDTVMGFFDSVDEPNKLIDWRNTLLDRLVKGS